MDRTLSAEAGIQFDTHKGFEFTLEQEAQVGLWLAAMVESHNRRTGSIEYVFCSDEQLLEINRKHLNHDYYTDIITFPLSEDPLEACIYISIDRVKENADLYGNTFSDELHRVLVHGLLHLLGHNDKTNDEIQAMRSNSNYCSLNCPTPSTRKKTFPPK